jgi:hypothetical protein
MERHFPDRGSIGVSVALKVSRALVSLGALAYDALINHGERFAKGQLRNNIRSHEGEPFHDIHCASLFHFF